MLRGVPRMDSVRHQPVSHVYLAQMPERPPLQLAAIRRVVVGSANPVKVGAVRAVIGRIAPDARVEGLVVASTVPDQPWGDEETIRGAESRASAALAAGRSDGVELAVGIEGGVVESADGGLRTCAWAAAISRDGRRGVGGSLSMPLPPKVAALVRGGLELGAAMDRVAGAHDTKRGPGAVGLLTAGLVDRQRAYEVLVTYALAPWLAPAAWED